MEHAIYLVTLVGTGLVVAAAFSSLIAFRFGAPLLLLFLGIGLASGGDGLELAQCGEPGYEAAEACIAERLPPGLATSGRLLHVDNKIDLLSGVAASQAAASPIGKGMLEGWANLSAGDRLAVSALTGAGLDALRRRLLAMAGWHAEPEGVFIARSRHLDALRRTREHLELAAAHAEAGDAQLELLAEELRLAHDALGEITGAFTSDDLLGVIFSRFCIGK